MVVVVLMVRGIVNGEGIVVVVVRGVNVVVVVKVRGIVRGKEGIVVVGVRRLVRVKVRIL